MTIDERLLDKAKEAFVMAIEIYNKPSIHYRLEGFSFFICNAWELMLKSHIIKKWGETEVYYKDKPDRTISLENCVQKVFTNEKSPLRQNLTKIIELRNTSTHFITEEYEMVYIPLLQACVFNFVDKMLDFHGVDMTTVIPENFITLSVRTKSLDETEIRGKYGSQISERILRIRDNLEPLIAEQNNSFAIRVEHYHYQTKKRDEATEVYFIDKDAQDPAVVIKELKDPNDTHKYSAKKCIEEINKRLKRNGIAVMYNGKATDITQYHFGHFVTYFDMKANTRFCYAHHVYEQPSYTYSLQAIDFIVDEIKKAPDHILDDLKQKCAKKKS